MTATKKVNELTNVGTILDGDVLVGERTNGTTVRITYAAPTGVTDGDKGDITVASSGTVWTIDTPVATTVATDDKVLIKDTSASDATKYVTAQSIANLAGVTDGDKGDITVSSSGTIWTVDNTAITYAKIQDVSATARILGRNTAGAGSIEELTTSTVKTMLSLNNVENTALSTWAGSTNLTTLGTISTGTWNGTTISVANGGTGKTSVTAYAPLVGGTTSTGAFQSTASGSTGQILQSAGNAAVPTWSTPTYPSASGTSRKILVSDGTNNVYSTETYAVPGSAGNLLRSDGTNWTAAKATLTTDVTGVLPVANGGTNASSASITAFNNITGYTASGATGTTSTNLVFAQSPALLQPTADNFINGYATTATAAGTTTLTVTSKNTQVFTGSTTQTVVLPVVSTLVLGTSYRIVNQSTGVVTVQSSGANTVQAMQANSTLVLTSNATTGTGSSVWDIIEYVPASSGQTGSGSLVRATSPTFVTPDLGAASATSVSFSSTSGIIGTTTNDNAAAGSVGEVISSVVSGVAITSNTNTNVTSISLTAGDWDVTGNVTTSPAGTTVTTALIGDINTTSASFSSQFNQMNFNTTGVSAGLDTPSKRISISGTTTVYLIGYVVYTTSTLTISGTLIARRAR